MMKYVVNEFDRQVVMMTTEELEQYNQKIWEEDELVLYLQEVAQDTMYFGVRDI